MTELQLIAKLQRYNTNHILHLLISLITAGLWIIPWVLVAVSNAIERGRINSKISNLANRPIGG